MEKERYYMVSWTNRPEKIEQFCRDLYYDNRAIGFKEPRFGEDGETWVLICPDK